MLKSHGLHRAWWRWWSSRSFVAGGKVTVEVIQEDKTSLGSLAEITVRRCDGCREQSFSPVLGRSSKAKSPWIWRKSKDQSPRPWRFGHKTLECVCVCVLSKY